MRCAITRMTADKPVATVIEVTEQFVGLDKTRRRRNTSEGG